MPFLTPTTAWQNVTLASDENWQARGGDVYVTTEASPPTGGGIRLGAGLVYEFGAGKTVYYRNAMLPAAQVWREVK